MICPSYSNFRSVFSITGTPVADGWEEWPVALVRANSIPAITGFPFPLSVFSFTLTIDGGALGANVYNAYLSQRNDNIPTQWIEIEEVAGTSGSWRLNLTGAAVDDLELDGGPTQPLTEDQVLMICRDVTLYVQRQSDDAIQLVRFDYSAFGYPVPPVWVAES